ncbi:MAG: hypothetical protein WAM82_30830 [Thermoanaerobaculia bacterium]
MKIDRFSSAPIRKAGALLVGLVLAAGVATAGGLKIGRVTILSIDSPSKKLAEALAPQVQEVQTRLTENRRALRTMQSSDGKPAYLRKDVADLITRTGSDLDQAIVKVQPSALAPLRAWSDAELARIQAELGALPKPKIADFSSDSFTPRAVAVFASLSSPPKRAKPKAVAPKAATPQPVAPPPDTVPAEKTNSLLDEVGEVVSRIFVLASHDDLEVKLWVGSTAPHVAFSFWSQGQIKGTTQANLTIRTNDKRDHVIRGLYDYRAAWAKGAVTQVIEYPNPAGTQAAGGERLDLVKGSSFFCCRFDEHYCHHVNNEKDCRP